MTCISSAKESRKNKIIDAMKYLSKGTKFSTGNCIKTGTNRLGKDALELM